VSPLALTLVLAAAVVHALWNRLLHATADREATLAVAGLAIGVVLLPAALLTAPWQVWPLVLLSAVAETAYALCLAAAYRRGALSIAYPLGRGAAPLLVTLGGWLALDEGPSAATLAGAVLLGGGLAIVATAGWRSGQGQAVAFALLTGATIAVYSVIDAAAVRRVSALGYLGAVFLLTGLLLVGWLGGDRARLRQAVGPGLRVAAGSAAAYLLVLLAFQRAEAGRVATLREASVLVGLWLAAERPGWRVWAGAGLVVAGIVLAAG
jgi:drug/metabolite transporter (DMT)-like permease